MEIGHYATCRSDVVVRIRKVLVISQDYTRKVLNLASF